MNHSFSSSFSSNSTIFSTPFFPITAGTPIETSFCPYSPSKLVETGITCFLSCTTDSIIAEIAFPGAWTVAPLSLITSAATPFVAVKISSSFSFASIVGNGIPETVANLVNGNMFSPCSPITNAFVDSREYPVASCMNCLNRDKSNIPPIPKTLLLSNPEVLYAICAIGSSGFVTGIIIASSANFFMLPTTSFTTPALIFNKSILVIPGFLPAPATTTTILEPLISS